MQEEAAGGHSMERGLLLPREECIAFRNRPAVYPENTRRVFVVWLPAGSFNPYPLSRLASIIDLLAGDMRNKIDME